MTSIPVRGMDLLLSGSYLDTLSDIFPQLEAFGEFHPNMGAGLDTRKRNGVVCGVCIHEHEFRIRIAWDLVNQT